MCAEWSATTASAAATKAIGAALGPELVPGDIISLSGDLGAGKTVFVQGLAAGLGVQDRVTSPSFSLIHEYRGQFPIVHMDVYRLDSLQEVLDLGFEELLDPTSILVIEWGEAVAPLLPPGHLDLEIRLADLAARDTRSLRFRAEGRDWHRKLAAMRSTAELLLQLAERGVETTWSGPGRPTRDDRSATDP